MRHFDRIAEQDGVLPGGDKEGGTFRSTALADRSPRN